MKYKKGQKVRVKSQIGANTKGPMTEIGYTFTIKNCKPVDCEGKPSYFDGMFWKSEIDLEPVNEFQIPFYVDCPTQEIWDKVEQKMFDMGYTWGEKGTNHSSFEKNQPILFCGYLKIPSFPGRTGMFYAQKGDTFLNSAKHIPYQQFLGEEGVMKEREFRVGDVVEVTNTDGGDFHGGREYIGVTFTITETGKYKDKTVYILSPYTGYLWYDSELKLITPVEEKEEKHKKLKEEMEAFRYVPEYSQPPMWIDWDEKIEATRKQVNPFYKLSKSLMSGFKKATAFIKRLGEPLSTYYSLGWVELEDDEFTTTSEGKQALADFTLIGGAKTFEEYAKKELARRKKASKVKDEEED